MLTTTLAALCTGLASLVLPSLSIPAAAQALTAAFLFPALAASRLAFRQLIHHRAPRICLIGDPDFCDNASEFIDRNRAPFQVHTLCTEAAEGLDPASRVDPGVLPSANSTGGEIIPDRSANASPSLTEWLSDRDFDLIVFQSASPACVLGALLDTIDLGSRVVSYTEFVQTYHRQIPLDEIDELWFLEHSIAGNHPFYLAVKRGMDIALALSGLVFAAPLVGLAALAIRLEGPGPIFYSQQRVGRYNRPFRIYKLRSMGIDAERDGAQWASQSDPRITWVGQILRKSRIDELPQFWNILRGDMAFIGPRPERPEFVRDLSRKISFYDKRHLVRPGLTGWAQIHYPYGSSITDARCKLAFDLYYVKTASIELDLNILIRTIGSAMKGAR